VRLAFEKAGSRRLFFWPASFSQRFSASVLAGYL